MDRETVGSVHHLHCHNAADLHTAVGALAAAEVGQESMAGLDLCWVMRQAEVMPAGVLLHQEILTPLQAGGLHFLVHSWGFYIAFAL